MFPIFEPQIYETFVPFVTFICFLSEFMFAVRSFAEKELLMLVNVNSAKCIGIDAVLVNVEVDIAQGIGIHLVGLADVAVKESLLRTVTALSALEYKIPGRRIVINLAPADLHKSGSGYDLPIAIGIIAASGQCALPELDSYILMGELGLDGSIRDVPGALPVADFAASAGFKGCILPQKSALEAVEFRDANIYGVSSLPEVVRILSGQEDCSDLLIWNSQCYRKLQREKQHHGVKAPKGMDFADIVGQEGAKRAAEIAASGGHNLLLLGPPGAGKSSLAKAMSMIMPPMTKEESIVTSKIYSVAGQGSRGSGLIRERPFRTPHYSASLAAVIGGGAGDNILPGEITLAHNGVLFWDEFGQTPRSLIEALRGPLEDRKVTISRLRSKVEYPASFTLVAASNPCPCGFYGEGDRCTCTPSQRQTYLGRLSGPVLDRIDLHVWMHPVQSGCVFNAQRTESSADVAARVLKARIIQKQRFATESIHTNAEMSNKQIEKYCPLSSACQEVLQRIVDNMQLSMRAFYRIIRVSRTIADLDGSDEILPRHLVEAAGYRFLDRQNI